MYVLLLNSPAHAINVWSGMVRKFLTIKKPFRSWIKFFMKGCLKIALFVLHTRLVYLMKLGVCVQRTITDLSSLIHKRVQNCSTELCVGFQLMITNTLVRCQFNMYLQWEFHIVLCYVFSSIKSTLVCLNVIKTPLM